MSSTKRVSGDYTIIANNITVSGNLAVTGPITGNRLNSFTVAGLPSASPAGQMVLVTNDSVYTTMVVFSNGTNWRRVVDNTIVT
jgi:hypothetical protein